ncbi:NADP-dependent malic enzyme [Faecalibacterium sp. An192]|uniref:NAD(P)-dependent malic enzyme n=1 Tax=Faecalibacterium sp. An192 TaxID=1965581 RepID=UPI000B3AD574|nr:NADP-dependent malic enzyme [Faecalibacterium sp. An192]OUP26516.1 NAD-dependent malic enzyme [Faecalibacterium sp. An192]
MNYAEESLELHRRVRGKLEVTTRVPTDSREALSLAYTPGVAAPCLAIQKDPAQSYELTRRWNTVAVVTDGTAVLGLGDIGPEAGMPVMEGKCVLFKNFGGVDAIPLCIRSKDVDEIVRTVSLLAGSFGGINLEDISAPRCFEIEQKLQAACDIPVFHDDQHGTAIVVSAALINALQLTGKKMEEIRVVQNGPGAAGTAIIKMLQSMGVQDIVAVDEHGVLYPGRPAGLAGHKAALAEVTNPRRLTGGLAEAVEGADVFIGTSVPGCLTADMVRTMNRDAIVFACANPTPEIDPALAKEAGAAVVCTGRSDYPNQVNNVLVFPGLFRGVLDARASRVTEGMKIAAAHAIADLIPASELHSENILPLAFDSRVRDAVASAVAQAARADGVARV